jgi:ribosomal protein L29
MKTKDFKDLRTKDLKTLKKLALEKKQEAIKAKMGGVSSKEKNLKLALNIRREVAKILTLIKEKEILESLQVSEKGGKAGRDSYGASSD